MCFSMCDGCTWRSTFTSQGKALYSLLASLRNYCIALVLNVTLFTLFISLLAQPLPDTLGVSLGPQSYTETTEEGEWTED